MSPDPFVLRVAANFLKYRKLAKLTQAQVARKAQVTVETVARFDRILSPAGQHSANANPTLETLAKLAAAVGVKASTLLMESGVMPPVRDYDPFVALLSQASPRVKEILLVCGNALMAEEYDAAHRKSARAFVEEGRLNQAKLQNVAKKTQRKR